MYSLGSYIHSPLFPYLFAAALAIPFILLLRRFVYEYIRMKNEELKMLAIKGNSENKSHACERMVLFLERIKPSNLVSKFDSSLAPHEFVFLTKKTIQDEFQYNASQQLYLTRNSWQKIADSKNAILKILHKAYESLDENATLEDFKTIFLINYINGEDFIGDTVDYLRREFSIVA